MPSAPTFPMPPSKEMDSSMNILLFDESSEIFAEMKNRYITLCEVLGCVIFSEVYYIILNIAFDPFENCLKIGNIIIMYDYYTYPHVLY